MKMWKKMLFMTLPLAGLLVVNAPDVEAHSRHHKHYKRDRHCYPYYRGGWHDRGRYDYYGRRGWYEGRRPYYDDWYYPSRYPYRPYYDRWRHDRPYYNGSDWWWILGR